MPNNNQTIGETIDAIVKIDNQIDALKAKIKPLDEQRDALEAQLLQQFKDEDTTSAKTKKATAFITRTNFANIETDKWPKFWEWVFKNKAIDVLQRRVTSTALLDRLGAGEKIPGATTGTRTSVTVKRI